MSRDDSNPAWSGDSPVSPLGYDTPVPAVVGALLVDLADNTNKSRVIATLAEWERRYCQCRRMELGVDPLSDVDGDPPSHRVPVDGAVVEKIVENILDDRKRRVARRLVTAGEMI